MYGGSSASSDQITIQIKGNPSKHDNSHEIHKYSTCVDVIIWRGCIARCNMYILIYMIHVYTCTCTVHCEYYYCVEIIVHCYGDPIIRGISLHTGHSGGGTLRLSLLLLLPRGSRSHPGHRPDRGRQRLQAARGVHPSPPWFCGELPHSGRGDQVGPCHWTRQRGYHNNTSQCMCVSHAMCVYTVQCQIFKRRTIFAEFETFPKNNY